MPKPRRSLLLSRAVESEHGEALDTSVELSSRRSILRTVAVPQSGSPVRHNAASTSSDALRRKSVMNVAANDNALNDPNIFFSCIKLAAENKINVKNAFNLAMIDFLTHAVKSDTSPLADNFQLAGCSIDAGTKVYAARVDAVAANMANFAVSMTMMKKGDKRGGGDDDDDDNDANDMDGDEGREKKKKKKPKVRTRVLCKTEQEMQMDFSKAIPKNKMYSLVGNLMDSSIDSYSFSFGDRAARGCIKNMMYCELEQETDKEFEDVFIDLPDLSDNVQLCPTFANFKFKVGANLESTFRLDTNTTINRQDPNRSRRFIDDSMNRSFLDPGLDDAANLPFDDDDNDLGNDLNASLSNTILEEVATCAVARREPTALLEDNFEFKYTPLLNDKDVTYAFDINEKDFKQLHGPQYWKYKKPILRPVDSAAQTTRPKKALDIDPTDFDGPAPDVDKIAKKRAKTYLSRDTLMRWDTEKYLLPTEELQDIIMMSEKDLSKNILDIGLVKGLKIGVAGRTENKEEQQQQQTPAADNQQEDNRVPYDFANQPDQQDYCPFPIQEIMPSDDEGVDPADDSIDDPEALMHLFNMLEHSDTEDQEEPDVFSESRLISEPANLVATIAPKWKAKRGVNMKFMEALLWKEINDNEEKQKETEEELNRLDKFYSSLPEKIQKHASYTTTLYALLNLANKKGLELTNNEDMSEITVKKLPVRDGTRRQSRIHPALMSSTNNDTM